MSNEVQLTGSLTIGAVDVADFVSSIVIKRTRSSVTVPPTLGNIREHEKAGALKEAVEINFYSSLAATSLWADLYDAIDTDSAELAFTGNLNSGATSADNPEFSGTFVVLGIDTGADVGSLREQSQTYPVTDAGIAKSITP